MDQEMALFLGCFVQLWYVIASFLTVSVPVHLGIQVQSVSLDNF